MLAVLIFYSGYCLANFGPIASCIPFTVPVIASGVAILLIHRRSVELLTFNSDKALEALQLTPKDINIYLYIAIFTIGASVLYFVYISFRVLFINDDITTWREMSYSIYDLSGF